MKTASSPWTDGLPAAVRERLDGGAFTPCRIGLSGAEVWLSDTQALKIAPASDESQTERTALRWLAGRLPVPALLADARENGRDYLLTERLKAVSAAVGALLDDPDRLLVLLSGALRALRDVDLGGCPLPDATGAKLRAAKVQVESGLCEPDEAVLSAHGFDSPASLLSWLETHRPKEHAVFTHGDCCLPNLFFDGGGCAFFLDLGRAGIADAYTDIALCLRSLRQNLAGVYDGKVRRTVSEDAFFDALGLRPDAEKLRYYTLLDELL